MTLQNLPLFSNSYLAACWKGEFQDFVDNHETELIDRLRHWANKDFQKETTARAPSLKYSSNGPGDIVRLAKAHEKKDIHAITDLEKMEAKAENRVSLAELSKRKSDGVYYTPEWVTQYIVQEVVGSRLRDVKNEVGLPEYARFSEDDVAAFLKGRERSAIKGYLEALDKYYSALEGITAVDPACGAGAFLIQAFNYLLNERTWIANERRRLTNTGSLFDLKAEMRSVLTHNIFGVDINQESVEITKLALWLRTALPDRPLSVLDNNILCGNSLVGPDFYARLDHNLSLFDEEKRKQINSFDWQAAFPKIFARGGFDCVVGNPPYVKLQHVKQAQPEVAEYLANAMVNGRPLFESTQTGNFDLYLPFIERGLSLLNPQGRMGYIAPSLWTVNEYGDGLRSLLFRTRQLERWVDFKSYQVFEEAITYTALQFFTASANDAVQCLFAPNGNEDLSTAELSQSHDRIPYEQIRHQDAWLLIPIEAMKIIRKLETNSKPLGDKCNTMHIFQGIITSAEEIYHVEKIAPGIFRQHLHDGTVAEVEIEDVLMKPLVSGKEAKRYQLPKTKTFLLFPYEISGENPRLLSVKEMKERFPLGWSYLKHYEVQLRAREHGKFNDDQWYRFGRNQNIDKQELPKLMVPRLVNTLACSIDAAGEYYLDNVDVNGIIVNNEEMLYYLAGIINSPFLNFVWRQISKPFQNDYRSANKQFIAPLPIPSATSGAKGNSWEVSKGTAVLNI